MGDVPFSFPLLKHADIVTCLNNLNIPVTLAQMKAPTEETLRPVLDKLCEYLKGTSREELKQMQFSGMDAFAYPELHEESIVEMGLFKEQLDLCYMTGLTDVSITDIVAPQPARTKKILSALINFAKVRRERTREGTGPAQHASRARTEAVGLGV